MSNDITMFLGGVFNIVDPFFGLQIYFWMWIALWFFTICVWLAFRYAAWEKYKVLWGLYFAYKAASKAAIIFNLVLSLEILSEAKAKCIFDYSKYTYTGFSDNRVKAWFERFVFYYPSAYLPDLDAGTAVLNKFGKRNMDIEIARHLQGGTLDDAPTSVGITGTDCDLILDADRWTVPHSMQHKIIARFCEIWNDGPARGIDEIHTYSRFMKYILNGNIKIEGELSKLTPVSVIPWTRVDASFPVDVEDNEQAGARRQQAEDESRNEANEYNKYIPHILIGGLGFAAVVLAARFISFLVSAPKAP